MPVIEQAGLAARGNGHRWRVVLAVALLIATVGQVGPSKGTALGPVIAVTPDEVIPNGFVGEVFHPSVSGRGETVGVHDHEVREDAFVLLDVVGQEPMARGYGTAVSSDRCVALWARDSGSTDPNAAIAFGITNRCAGFERVIGTTSVNYDFPVRRLAVSANGRFAAVEFASCFACEFDPSRVVRIDTETLEQRLMPIPTIFYQTDSSLGLDISDDGNIITTVVTPGATQEVAVWNVGTDQVTIPSNPTGVTSGGLAAFPSVSGDGRFVSFASTRNNPRVAGRGPWVFVTPVAGGPLVRVSGVTEGAYYSSLSGDGSQIAYGVTASSACALTMTDLTTLEGQCPTTRIDVAYSATPGLSAGVNYDTISLNTAGSVAAGRHMEPDLSANGRWVTWVSDNGIDLVGTGDLSRFKGLRQAFLRRRDPGLTISPNPVDFATIGASTSSVLTATVTNTGRTSVVMDSISATPARFSIVGGGSCAQGASLPPGASCTVNVQFRAPASATTVNGSLVVGETLFDPVQASARLIGRSSVTTTTSTTTTTLPPAVTTTTVRGQQIPPPPTVTTTIPGVPLLDAQPSPVDFGQVAVGIAAPFQTVTVTNIGTASGVVATEMLGANPDDFFVNENLCSGATLAPGASCTISVTMVALLGGPRTAELTVTSGGEGGSATLQGVGRFAPRMVASPGAMTERGFTTVVGQGFPPNEVFEVRILETSLVFPVTSDATGVFRLPLSPLTLRLRLGDYVLSVPATSAFEEVKAAFVVVLPTFQPQGPGGPAFGNTLLVTRG